jgi:hypothetical protein
MFDIWPLRGHARSHRITTVSKAVVILWEITQPFRAALSRSKLEMYGFRSAQR